MLAAAIGALVLVQRHPRWANRLAGFAVFAGLALLVVLIVVTIGLVDRGPEYAPTPLGPSAWACIVAIITGIVGLVKVANRYKRAERPRSTRWQQ
ncbi:hypothetical protein ACQUSY_05490 [Microbacterium sp. YY-03]|uniref:hypothetical protein n=1 Tax=Microbacterium sp. YY-03 TaxID=3421636 RepID=UPI003D16F66F